MVSNPAVSSFSPTAFFISLKLFHGIVIAGSQFLFVPLLGAGNSLGLWLQEWLLQQLPVLFWPPITLGWIYRWFYKWTLLYHTALFIAVIPRPAVLVWSTDRKSYTATDSFFSSKSLRKTRPYVVKSLPEVSCSRWVWCSGWSMAGTEQEFSLAFPGTAWTVLPE